MDFAEFVHIVRDALSKLYDHVALETHPLNAFFARPADRPISRGEHLRRLLIGALEELRPIGETPGAVPVEPAPGAIEWRPYLVLHGRYVEGLSLPELQAKLALSERQLRREHSRALQALAFRLWDRLAPAERARPAVSASEPAFETMAEASYSLIRRPVSLDELLAGVAATFQPYAQVEGVELRLSVPDSLPPVQGDRVLMRSILLSLLRLAASYEPEGPILLRAEARPGSTELTIEFCPADYCSEDGSANIPNGSAPRIPLRATQGAPSAWRPEGRDEGPAGPAWAAAQGWAAQLGATLSETRPQPLQGKPVRRWTLTLPQVAQPVLLVVDDQSSAVNLFRRYLSRSAFQVVGVTDPKEALPAAQRLRPAAIILDVMMPTMDGWELLQALQAAPATRDIPVIVCSVWDEPELASALGATLFVKKPVTQRDLLAALARLGLAEPPA